MNHTSGIPAVTAQSAFYLAALNSPDKHWTAKELVKYIYNKPEEYCCGKDKASYSDSNTLLLSMILDKILGYHHSIALKSMVLDPLGMNSTYYFPHQNLPANTARGYFDLYNNNTITDVTNINTGSGNGYGGTYSTVLDLSRYIETVWRNKTFISQAAMQEMQKFVQEEINETNSKDTLFLGQCLMRRFTYIKPGSYGIGHTGRDLGYNANAFYFPKEDVTMTLIVNYGTNGKSNLKPVFLEFQDEIMKLILN
jgi:D-alanyl-D-alanine carboxypeptidase